VDVALLVVGTVVAAVAAIAAVDTWMAARAANRTGASLSAI